MKSRLLIGIGMMVMASVCMAEGNQVVLGTTYEFAEKDLLVEFQQRVEKKKPEADKVMSDLQKKAKEKILTWKPDGLDKLIPAKQDREFYPDLTYTLEQDIMDAEGRVLYPRGFKYNLGDYLNMPFRVIVFDPTVKKQKEWIAKNGYDKDVGTVLLITDGQALKLGEEYKRPVFYSAKPLVDRWGLKRTPSVVMQIGNKIKVSEINLYGRKER